MKKITLVSALWIVGWIPMKGQVLDTLYANAHQVVSLSFESPIQKGITGSANFAFSFNQEAAEKLGLLQAKEGKQSNLLVRTIDGKLYGFLLAYREDLDQLHHFIPMAHALKKPASKEAIDAMKTDSITIAIHTKNDYAKNCQKLLEGKRPFHHIKRQKGLRVRMAESLYYHNSVYVVYELQNRSAIPYELGQLQLIKVLGTQKRKASYQELPITPLYAYQLPETIGPGWTHRFVVVYPKFTLNKEERFQLKVLEAKGSRNLVVRLR